MNALALTIVRRPWTVIVSGILVVVAVSCVAFSQVLAHHSSLRRCFFLYIHDTGVLLDDRSPLSF